MLTVLAYSESPARQSGAGRHIFYSTCGHHRKRYGLGGQRASAGEFRPLRPARDGQFGAARGFSSGHQQATKCHSEHVGDAIMEPGSHAAWLVDGQIQSAFGCQRDAFGCGLASGAGGVCRRCVRGLFADLGRLLIALALPDEHEQIRGLCTSKRFSRCECEMEVFGFTHAELSADALEIWNLPEEIREAVLHHHTVYDEPLEDNGIRLSTVVGATDLYVNAIGYAMDKLDEGPVDAAMTQLEMFGLGERSGPVIEEFLVEFNGIRAMF